ncbi:T9SS type A sorting domain-containing protein [Sunxiuqinia indica]|uniref:T9SS type A sorting domain-containing protein n=1 Tax=Sunxiuqinia indica TaxID=2692584 RepID=UPI001357C4FA|nr:T9SS type A sorting domain-containing protein [Sunxiuqinia indica]
MRKLSILLTFSLFLIVGAKYNATAQTTYYRYQFSYDDDGNREKRIYVGTQLKSATIENPIAFDESEPAIDKIGFDQIKIYPNPTKGNLIVEMPDLEGDKAQIRVLNLQGKQIISSMAFPNSRNSIDLTHFSSGMYVMTICVGSECSDWKIIKE